MDALSQYKSHMQSIEMGNDSHYIAKVIIVYVPGWEEIWTGIFVLLGFYVHIGRCAWSDMKHAGERETAFFFGSRQEF